MLPRLLTTSAAKRAVSIEDNFANLEGLIERRVSSVTMSWR